MRPLALALVVASCVWLAAILIAPLDGVPALLAAGAYAAGSFVCHQRPERAFHLAGAPMPVCARCFGLYASAAAGGLIALAMSPPAPSPRAARRWIAVAALPTVLTLLIEVAGLAHPASALRALAAVPLGAAAAWVVVRTLR